MLWLYLSPCLLSAGATCGGRISLHGSLSIITEKVGNTRTMDREHFLCLFSGHPSWWALHCITVDTYRGRNHFNGLLFAARYTARKHMFYMGFCNWMEVQASPNLVHSFSPSLECKETFVQKWISYIKRHLI